MVWWEHVLGIAIRQLDHDSVFPLSNGYGHLMKINNTAIPQLKGGPIHLPKKRNLYRIDGFFCLWRLLGISHPQELIKMIDFGLPKSGTCMCTLLRQTNAQPMLFIFSFSTAQNQVIFNALLIKIGIGVLHLFLRIIWVL